MKMKNQNIKTLCDASKADQKKIYSFTDLYLESPQTNKIIFCLKISKKRKRNTTQMKEILKIRVEINKIKNRKTIE